ncbi:hypothetical protein PHMEG_00026540 [Phytophthora megakarya]|uniref:HTH CENPB-type domain-containing protein n=1 Tax=Phytophthora megakarya TaxID=4795 RepID=A0A225V9D1_9STRA|nr:hypothetical protein PHMEG_00026540 [Phytophthora megakarya]
MTSLTLEEKLQVCLKDQREPSIKDGDLLLWVHRTMKRLSASAHADSTATRRRLVKFPELVQQLVAFFMNMKKKTITSDDILLLKATDIKKTLSITDDQLRLSNSWLAKFKKRNGISLTRLHGEADSSPAVEVRSARYSLQDVTCHYRPEDIYNFDETALFYRLAPSQTLATGQRKGKKRDKARITIAFCCNKTGAHKLNPLVIGTSANPRCFWGGACLPLKRKPVEYYHSAKAWMTSTVFFEWLQSFNLNMAVENRKELLLVDNTSRHKVVKTLSNIEVHFFAPNLTSLVQPLDAVIQDSISSTICSLVPRRIFKSNIKRKLNVFEAIQFSIDSWGDVSADCIRNCWVKARIINAYVKAELRQAGYYSVTAEQKLLMI